MTSVKDLIKQVRYILVDAPNLSEARGWADPRLVDLIDEAQKDIAINSRIFKREFYVSLAQGKYTYTLPDNFISADRFMTWERRIPEVSMNDLDEQSATWRTESGDEVEAIIQDSVNMNQLEVYPKPSDKLTYTPFYTIINFEGKWYFVLHRSTGVLGGTDPEIALYNPETGVLMSSTGNVDINSIADFDYDETYWGILTDWLGASPDESRELFPDQPTGVLSNVNEVHFGSQDPRLWGVTTDVHQGFGLIGDGWGLVSSTAKANAVLKVRYSALPQTLKYSDASIALPDKWVTAIKYYVAGYALLDDNDAANSQKGLAFLQRYGKEIERLVGLGTSTDAKRSATSYRGLGRKKQINKEEDY